VLSVRHMRCIFLCRSLACVRPLRLTSHLDLVGLVPLVSVLVRQNPGDTYESDDDALAVPAPYHVPTEVEADASEDPPAKVSPGGVAGG